MVNKTLKKKARAKPVKTTFAAPVVDSARDLLFAGLGAFSVAQQEGEKLIGQGSKLFDKLVSEGAKMEKRSIGLAETAVDDIRHDVESRIKGVRKQANENWDSLGSVFDERVSGTLERLGIPNSKDLSMLSGRVQTMTQQATKSWKEFEGQFEKRVSEALAKLHVPDVDDVNRLSESVQKVSKEAADSMGKLESAFEKRVSGAIGELEEATTGEFKKLNKNMQDNLDRLESMVESRVTKVLGGLNIPSTDDTNRLAAELKKLSNQVSALEKQLKANAKPKAVTPKAAVKKQAVVKKAAVTKAVTSTSVTDKAKLAEVVSKPNPADKPTTTS